MAKKRKISFFKIIILTFIVFFLTGIIGAGYIFYSIASLDTLPEPDIALTSKFYDSNGDLLTTMYQEDRWEVTLNEIPLELQQAVIAVEDAHFYDHFGINLLSIGRAALRNIQKGRIVEGGSTITQQLAKNIYLTHDRTFQRKADELILTLHLERTYTKDEILNMYLNIIYFGHGNYGVESAAKRYFGKSAKDLTLAESSMLAGIPRGPGYYSPLIEGNQQAARNRQTHVLNRMVELEFITPAQKQEALDQELVYKSLESGDRPAGHFINYIASTHLEVLLDIQREDVYRGGLNIYTTLDPTMQAAAEDALRQELENFSQSYVDEQGILQPQGALVAVDPTNGHVKALVGGLNYRESNLNRAIDSKRQPGSAFKPFIYAKALDSGYTAASQILCEPIAIPNPGSNKDYEPKDYGGGFHYRHLTVREALVLSCNVSAVKVHMDIGPEETIRYAHNMGIKSHLDPYPSLALGTSTVTALEMAAAYIPLANGGMAAEPVFVTRITDHRGRVLWEQDYKQTAALDERVAYILTDILKGVLVYPGTGSAAGDILKRPAAGKTGTSNDYTDAYMVGYTPQLVASVYVGDDHNKSLGQTGGKLAVPIWANFMAKALMDYSPQDFSMPQGILQVKLCAETGLRQNERCSGPALEEIFISGTEPQEYCSEDTCPYVEPERRWQWPFDIPQLPWF
ncbi:transglycosylase domain-containing protein [Candidatus Contubernalis alkaliaceticus]|uniref:transglycosylase domain-containing protein n=1 Tax=Candidatus Contubernalis alkaliaceticus TaxID=338645 RepID=UPI001F4C0B17|nr:PBP1A family penicillin-binding protein [Candidatus Contubernalis alkalaceticus]UNC93696.1 PBP1A family penicillin-binding protein [Candidatus Contubernalis alkalaceticus]